MWEPGKHTYRLLCLILALVSLMIGAPLAPEPAGRVSAQVVGPRSIATGNLNIARRLHTATLLLNGKVLITGGFNDAQLATLNSAELYDPVTGRWSETGSLNALLASEAIAAGFGAVLATMTSSATTLPLPTSLAGTTVEVKDIGGIERLAPLFFVSPTQ